ncbi:hypothetical protein BGW80DRAFT_1446424 [Lactifluus volemus]|nr:hypothetical protein BGW80DRAFT_1446424 [Lactifluus volemus]
MSHDTPMGHATRPRQWWRRGGGVAMMAPAEGRHQRAGRRGVRGCERRGNDATEKAREKGPLPATPASLSATLVRRVGLARRLSPGAVIIVVVVVEIVVFRVLVEVDDTRKKLGPLTAENGDSMPMTV